MAGAGAAQCPTPARVRANVLGAAGDTVSTENKLAESYAQQVIRMGTDARGAELSPMGNAEARITLGVMAVRHGAAAPMGLSSRYDRPEPWSLVRPGPLFPVCSNTGPWALQPVNPIDAIVDMLAPVVLISAGGLFANGLHQGNDEVSRLLDFGDQAHQRAGLATCDQPKAQLAADGVCRSVDQVQQTPAETQTAREIF